MHSMKRILTHGRWQRERTQEEGKPCWNVKSLFGFTDKEWAQVNATLRARQNDRCVVCDLPFTPIRRPVVEHDHSTLVIRGMACRRCNAAIAAIRDDPASAYRLYQHILRGVELDPIQVACALSGATLPAD